MTLAELNPEASPESIAILESFLAASKESLPLPDEAYVRFGAES